MAPVGNSSRRSPPYAKASTRVPYLPPLVLCRPPPNVPFSSPPLVSGPIVQTSRPLPAKRFRLHSNGSPRDVPPSFPPPTGSPFRTSSLSLPPQSRAPSGDLSLALRPGPVGTYMTASRITGLISLPPTAHLPPPSSVRPVSTGPSCTTTFSPGKFPRHSIMTFSVQCKFYMSSSLPRFSTIRTTSATSPLIPTG